MFLKSFTDIDAWKEARILVSEIYKITSAGNVRIDFGFKDQIRRAAVSIMSNIAEGFDSGSTKSFLVFLGYSYRSASEVLSLLYVALDCGYIDESTFSELEERTLSVQKMIGGFIKYLKTRIKK
jgi:four helix bundle protein